ncbi:rCG61612 [Rattus norvegicus]|uniref:RCG61612 n=1 Tax=Rattus norvegicus TaxID=10116 RepID=A6HCC7_RAT|nr:rCG61612 [Rattus norvegicus]
MNSCGLYPMDCILCRPWR